MDHVISFQEMSGTVIEAASSSAVPVEKQSEDAVPEKDTLDDFELPKKKKKKRPVSIFAKTWKPTISYVHVCTLKFDKQNFNKLVMGLEGETFNKLVGQILALKQWPMQISSVYTQGCLSPDESNV